MNRNLICELSVVFGIGVMIYSAFVFSYIIYFIGVITSIGGAILIKDDTRPERFDNT